ncbi:MAG: hypothetical protein AABX19_04440 [Nanoarchaeota archaeon]
MGEKSFIEFAIDISAKVFNRHDGLYRFELALEKTEGKLLLDEIINAGINRYGSDYSSDIIEATDRFYEIFIGVLESHRFHNRF